MLAMSLHCEKNEEEISKKMRNEAISVAAYAGYVAYVVKIW